MELKDFIHQTLKGIKDGIDLAEKDGVAIKKDNNTYNDVEFDIAVTFSKTSENSIGGGIQVLPIKLGGKMKDSKLTKNLNRISFRLVPLREDKK
ncbi:MAG: hypothetical protein K1X63_08525 [Chitinophagales bacterium]|nr:hypothetical protein [Chitinophagales bacterium]